MDIVLKNVAYVADLTVSSAKSRTLVLTESGRSFIYARKRHGPNTDPWGTPDKTGTVIVSEAHPSISTCLVRHCKNDLTHRAVSGLIPNADNLYISLL